MYSQSRSRAFSTDAKAKVFPKSWSVLKKKNACVCVWRLKKRTRMACHTIYGRGGTFFISRLISVFSHTTFLKEYDSIQNGEHCGTVLGTSVSPSVLFRILSEAFLCGNFMFSAMTPLFLRLLSSWTKNKKVLPLEVVMTTNIHFSEPQQQGF